jgi:hypothetical protein
MCRELTLVFEFGFFVKTNPLLIRKWYQRYQVDELAGKVYLDTQAGFYDAANTRNPSQLYADWSADMFWMSAYFSCAVWASIMLAYAPGRAETCNCSIRGLPLTDDQVAVPEGGPIVQSNV